MKRYLVLLSWALVLGGLASAAEAPYAEDMRFVQDLRTRGYSDLAREYLLKLAKTAPPELKKELPLEIALTNMEAAAEEPDSAKRIDLYAQARADLQKFLKDNPKHAREAEARLDIARATTLEGKTQLSRAKLEEDLPARVAEGLKARATLVEAANQLKQLPPSPRTELEMGVNLLDQADTYLNTGSDKELLDRAKPVQEARKILEKLAQGEANDKITWAARAWLGRCLQELGEPKKARDLLTEITSSTGAATAEGKRLARYFVLLVAKETREAPGTQRPEVYIVTRARDWLRDYPSYARTTAEGFGVRYLLAETLLAESENAKLAKPERDAMIADARKQLREVERTENDFTDRAKRLKIAIMNKQGAFQQPIAKLKGFEDCYVRAQYEVMQIREDEKKYQGNKDQIESARKARIAAAIEALESALKQPDAKGNPADGKGPPAEYNNARAMLAYYLLNEGKYKEAIEVGESFARNDPKPSQASMAAVYALLSYGELLSKRERGAADPKAARDDPQYKDDLEHMLSLAKYMEERWPKDRAGDLARHQIALRLLREEKYPEAIQKLATITPAYPSYIRTQYALAHASMQQAEADKDKGDPDGYRKRALAALTNLPDPQAGADVETNRDYVQAKAMLAREYAKDKKFAELDALLAALTPKVGQLHLVEDPAKDKELKGKFEDSLVQLRLFSQASQADADFKAGRYAEVTKRLDPIVDEFNADKLPQLKDGGMAPFVLGLALKANVQLNRIDRAKLVVKALQSLQSDKGGDGGTTAILAQLVKLIGDQVEELRKKGNKADLEKAQAGFTSILGDVAGGQKTPTPKLAYLLAKCYSGMGEHKKAADLLRTFAAQPTPDADAGLHHLIQLLLIEELRELKEFDKAKAQLDEIIGGKDGKPGWGAKNIDAQKLRVKLLEDKENYGAAAQLCAQFVKQLLPRIEDNKLKEQYLEFYYHLVYCIAKNAQGLSSPEQKAKGLKDAAQRIVALEKNQGGFGSDESRKRFQNLLDRETDLREQYNALKGGK